MVKVAASASECEWKTKRGGISQLCLCPALYIQDQRHDQRTIQELYEDKEHYYFSEAVACGQNDCAGLQHLLK